MKTVILHTESQTTIQTTGTLSADGFTCKTLELGWNNNENNISCIPAGEYPVKWTRSNRLSKAAGHDVFTYEILNVPDRGGIRIHSANFASQLLGCVALGKSFSDMNNDGQLDVVSSRLTVDAFSAFMNYNDFKLIVIRPS